MKTAILIYLDEKHKPAEVVFICDSDVAEQRLRILAQRMLKAVMPAQARAETPGDGSTVPRSTVC